MVDTYERFSNAINPISPFPKTKPHLRIASLLTLLILLSYLPTSHILLKSLGFLTGLLLFGAPIITHITNLLNQ